MKKTNQEKTILSKKWRIFLACFAFVFAATFAQAQSTVTGKVTDKKGGAIPMVNVLIKGTSHGGSANEDGVYSIVIPSSVSNPVLVFSFVGFTDKEEVVGTRTVINTTLEEAANELDEVIVVGYGKQKKSSLTGSVASMKAEALESRPVASVSAAMAGQMAGVTAIQSSGAPGSQTASITIRGKNSLNAASPLVIVDGVPGDMNSIDPADIDNISILKDASSSAIYGVQAANGVILITTKKGKVGQKARINYSGNFSIATPTARLQFLGSADYAMLYREAQLNEGVDPNALRFSEEDIEKYRTGAPGYYDVDWYKETFNTVATEQMHHISLNGGSDKANYNASVGYTNQGGLTDYVSYERINGRLSIDSKINEWLTAGLNASGYRGISKDGWNSAGGLVQYTNRIAPIYSIYKDNDPSKGFSRESGVDNPVAFLGQDGYRKNTSQQIHATLYGQIHFMPNLSLKGVYSVRNLQQFNMGFKRNFVYDGTSSGDREAYNDNYHSNWYTTQLIADYNKTFGKHSIAALAGFEQYLYTYKVTNASRKGGGSNELDESLKTLDASSQKNDSDDREVARRSYFGRLQYDYENKYFFEANVRMDGSSIFPKENRWGAFPAFSGGWVISREGFMQDQNIFSHLKLRAGWGLTGNEEVAAENIYPSATTYAYDKIILNNTIYSTTKEPRYANKALTWAKVQSYELALEANFFNNKLGFEFAAFKKQTTDMLLKLAVPGVLGLDAPLQNAGKVENTGFDLNIFHNLVVNQDFKYNLNFNLSFVHNEITDLRGKNSVDPDNDKYWRIEGEAIGSFYGYKANGYFNTAEDLATLPKRTQKEKLGDIKYENINDEDNVINGKDRTVIGKNFPSWNMGFSGNFVYKNFDLYFLLQGAFNVDAYYTHEAAYAFFNSGKVLERHLDRWTPDNHNASYPRITTSADKTNYEAYSSFWLQNASYVRLKNLSLGYSIPKHLIEKLKIENAKVFVSGENLLTFSGLEGLDPESPSDTRGGFYSNVKKYSIGLKITF